MCRSSGGSGACGGSRCMSKSEIEQLGSVDNRNGRSVRYGRMRVSSRNGYRKRKMLMLMLMLVSMFLLKLLLLVLLPMIVLTLALPATLDGFLQVLHALAELLVAVPHVGWRATAAARRRLLAAAHACRAEAPRLAPLESGVVQPRRW